MAIETLEEYLKRIKGSSSLNNETKIETIEDYAKNNNLTIVNQGIQNIFKEREAKKAYEQTKQQYNNAIKTNVQNIKKLNLDNYSKPFNTGADKTIKTTNYLPTQENLNKAKENAQKINTSPEVQKSREEANKIGNELTLDRYEYDVAKETTSNVTNWDKSVGRVLRVIPDLLSMADGTDRRYYDENGKKTVLKSANQLRDEHISNSYETSWGKFLGDAASTISKIAVSSVVPGGKALYWGDMFTDNATSVANEGYTGVEGLAYATLSTASELATEKLLGGLSKITPGGTSNFSKTINKTLSKVFKNDRLRSAISNALSEGTEEFVQEYVDLINRNVTLGENNKINMEQFENALYSGLVGMASGGFFGSVNVDVKTNNTGITGQENAQSANNIVQNTSPTKYSMQENQNNTQNKLSKLSINAKNIFGTTDDFSKAGFIIEDGNMLDFSNGYIQNEHSDIENIVGDMDNYIKSGAIRVGNKQETSLLDIGKKPTNDQIYKIMDFADTIVDKPLTIEMKNNDNSITIRYKDNINSTKVKNDIINYYNDNKIPNNVEILNNSSNISSRVLSIKEQQDKLINDWIKNGFIDSKDDPKIEKWKKNYPSIFNNEALISNNANQDIENNNDLKYNDFERKIDNETNELNGRATESVTEIRNKLPMEQSLQERKFTKEEWSTFERNAREKSKKIFTVKEQKLIKEIKDKFNKRIVFFDDINSLYIGGASLEKANDIYISQNINDDGKNFVIYHEIMESNIVHNKQLKSSFIDVAIDEIVNDPEFNKTKKSFIGNQYDLNNVSNKLIAKDIICDRFANSKTNIGLDYDIYLSKNTLDVIDYNIEAFNSKVYSKQKNYKATGTRTNFEDVKVLPKVEQKSAKPLPIIKDFSKKVVSNKTIQEKIGNNEIAIDKLRQEKIDSIKNIDLKIKNKRDLYQSKKNKNTKLANVLQQQAITLENQKNNIITAYNHRIEQLEERNKKMRTKEYQIQEQRKTKSAQYRDETVDLIIGNLSTWKDKEAGIWYKRETFERNIRDIIPDKQVAKQVIDKYVTPIYNATANEEVFINRYNEKIKELKLTKEESIAVQMLGEGKYNGSKTIIDKENAKNILHDNNSNSDAKYGAQLYLDAIDFIENNKLDYNKIKNSIKTFRSIYDEVFVKVNKVLKEQGYKEMEYRKDYFPHFTKETADTKIGRLMEKMGWKKKDNSIPTDIAAITDTFKPGKTYFKHLNRRYGNITEYNALEGFDNYIRGAADLVCLTEPIQKLRALENTIRYLHSEKGVQEQYEQIVNSDIDEDSKEQELNNILKNASTPLNNFVTELRSYTDNLANKKSELDRRTEYLFNRQVYSAMSNIESRVKANMVGANISSALTNFIPITQAWSQVSTKNLLKAMKLSLSNSIKSDGFSEQSEFLVNRTMKADRLYKTKLDNIADKAGVIFEAVDNFTSNTIVRGKYLDNIEKGMSKEEAIKNANRFARGLMAARDKGSLPTIFNSKSPFIKLFTSFQLEVNNQYSYMLKDLPNDLKDEASKRLIGAFIKMFLGAYIYNLFSEKITGRKSAFSPVDILVDSTTIATNQNMSTYDKLTNIVEDVAGEIPFVGGLIGGGRLPISSAIPSLSKTVQSGINLGDANKSKNAIKDLAKELSKPLFYIVPPFGGGQAKKTIEGLSMYTHDMPGSYTTSGKLRFTADKDILSIGQATVFGQYASKEARDYFNNGYSALTEKQQEELQTLNVSISTYREYQYDLKKWNEIKADKNADGNSISGTALAKSVYDMLNNNKEYSEKELNYFLSKLSNSEAPPTIEQLIQLDNDVDVYKYYFSLSNKDSKDKFITNINAFKFNQKNYVEHTKKIKEIDKKYSELSKKTDSQETKNSISNKKRSEIWKYIQSLGLSKAQKIILYSQSGYSITQYKSYMHDYINKLNITKAEKEKIWKGLYS